MMYEVYHQPFFNNQHVTANQMSAEKHLSKVVVGGKIKGMGIIVNYIVG